MIETRRLLLRLPVVAAAEALMEIHQDPVCAAAEAGHIDCALGGIDVALRNIAPMLRHWKQHNDGRWSVVERVNDQVIGCVGFFHRREQSEIEIGWFGIHRSPRASDAS